MTKNLLEKWTEDLKDLSLLNIYNNYLVTLDHIATNYSLSKLLINKVMIEPDIVLIRNCFKLSNNFPDSMTTIKTNEQLKDSILSREAEKINNYQTIMSLCTALECLLQSILKYLSIDGSEIRRSTLKINGKEIGNFTLKSIAVIHKKLSFNSIFFPRFESDPFNLKKSHEYTYISKIITLRNCIVHNHGKLDTQWKQKLSNTGFSYKEKNGFLFISENEIDDYIHFIIITMAAFINHLDQKL